MAITGLILVAFLIMHMFGNLKLLINDGGVEYNAYSKILRRLFYPVLPPMWFLWAFRIVLLASVILHIWSAAKLTRRRFANVPVNRYEVRRSMTDSFAARTMVWGGIIVLVFIVFHILEFTTQTVKVSYSNPNTTPYDRVIVGFQNWWLVLIYLVAMLAVCVHISHGFFSAFTTLGANTSPKARRVLQWLSYIVAALLFVGFMIPPFLILFGVIG